MKQGLWPVVWIITILIYGALATFALIQKTQWVFDAIASLFLLSIIYFFHRKISLWNVLLLNMLFLMNNLGTFDFYAWQMGFLQYDMVVHFLGAVIGFFLLVSAFPKNNTSLVLAMCLVLSLGAVLEIVEYGGHVFLGQGDGVFFTGLGDSGKWGDAAGQYYDSMQDLICNLLGVITAFAIRKTYIAEHL